MYQISRLLLTNCELELPTDTHTDGRTDIQRSETGETWLKPNYIARLSTG